jgi:transcription termination/antitermination protein NusG
MFLLPTAWRSMSNPTDNSTEPEPNPASPAQPGEPASEASIGPSNLFEVEELTPDGGTPTDHDTPEATPTTGEAGLGQRRTAGSKPKAASPAGKPKTEAPAMVEYDDDEPPPTLVWYVLKVQSGREDTIRDALERRVKIQGLERFFGRIVVPTEKITEIRNNKKRIVERKSYPGYIMVEMELNEKTWFVVRETPGVGDFVGAHGTPTKMTETEVNQMLGQETAKTEEAPRVRIDVERGDRVKIKDGPFENFEGTVEEVIEARGLVKVMLIIFNRPTPVDLEYWQVERI